MKKLLIFAFFTASLFAADVAGKWTGKVLIDGPDKVQVPLWAEFTQDGQTVSGTAGRRGERPASIQNVRLDGNTLAFEVKTSDNPAPYRLKLVLKGDRFEGDLVGKDGDSPIRGKVTLTRGSEK